jgi:hypothetical protein
MNPTAVWVSRAQGGVTVICVTALCGVLLSLWRDASSMRVELMLCVVFFNLWHVCRQIVLGWRSVL